MDKKFSVTNLIWKYSWFVIFIIIQAGTNPIYTYFVGRLLGSIGKDEFFNELIYVGVVGFGSQLITLLTNQLSSYGIAKLKCDIRLKIAKELLVKNSNFMETNSAAVLSSAILSDVGTFSVFVNHLIDVGKNFFQFAWYCVVVAIIKVEFFGVLFGNAIAVSAITAGATPALKRLMVKRVQKEKEFAKAQAEAINNWKIVRVFTLAKDFTERIEAIEMARKGIEREVQGILGGGNFAIALLNAGIIIAFAYWGNLYYQLNQLTIGEMYTVWTATSGVVGAVRFMTFQFPELLSSRSAMKNIDNVIQFGKFRIECKGTLPAPQEPWSLEMKNIVFQYPMAPQITLNGVDLTLKACTLNALVGASGSGKSTTASLLLNLYSDYGGLITVNNIDLKEFQMDSFYKQVAYVSQEVNLFDGTIEDNIKYGGSQASFADVEAACKMANLHDFVISLPEGYKTRIGDKGLKLSGGQRQRLSIARALVRKPKFLVFDEATSALDSQSEQLIQQAVERVSKEITILAIAHRLSTIKNATRIYVFMDGRIVEAGSYQELMALQGVFTGMVQTQNLAKTTDTSSRARSYTK